MKKRSSKKGPFKMGGYPDHATHEQYIDSAPTYVDQSVLDEGEAIRGKIEGTKIKRKQTLDKITDLVSSDFMTGIAKNIGSMFIGKALDKRKKKSTRIISGEQTKIA